MFLAICSGYAVDISSALLGGHSSLLLVKLPAYGVYVV
jgi:hypothetical protein